jgi:hypothetical protein
MDKERDSLIEKIKLLLIEHNYKIINSYIDENRCASYIYTIDTNKITIVISLYTMGHTPKEPGMLFDNVRIYNNIDNELFMKYELGGKYEGELVLLDYEIPNASFRVLEIFNLIKDRLSHFDK